MLLTFSTVFLESEMSKPGYVKEQQPQKENGRGRQTICGLNQSSPQSTLEMLRNFNLDQKCQPAGTP